MTTYTSTAVRGRRTWTVQCDQVPGAISEVAQLSQAAEHQREAIAFVLGIAERDVQVEVRAILPDSIQAVLDDLQHRIDEADKLATFVRSERTKVARMLHDDVELSVRDVGAVLAVSPQRAHQLIQAAD